MGRKKKFGEESDFVSVRVPKSKRKEYRTAIKSFVENKFAKETNSKNKNSVTPIIKKGSDKFRKFEEFVEQTEKLKKKKEKN
ncbi:hypothetical protein LCGC14_3109560, partial [marine sediment metagenome]